MKIHPLLILTFLIFINSSCKERTEVIREIEYRVEEDSSENKSSQLVDLGGVKIKFMYCDEFGGNEDTILPGTQLRIPFDDTLLISTVDENFEWFEFRGLQASGFFTTEIYQNENLHFKFRFTGSGVNDFYEILSAYPIIQQSNSELISINPDFQYDSIDGKALTFDYEVKGLGFDEEEVGRGVVAFISDKENPLESDALLIKHFSSVNKSQDEKGLIYNGQLRIGRSELEEHFVRGEKIYYTLHGLSGFYNNHNSVMKYYRQGLSYNVFLLEEYANKNPVSMNGMIRME